MYDLKATPATPSVPDNIRHLTIQLQQSEKQTLWNLKVLEPTWNEDRSHTELRNNTNKE